MPVPFALLYCATMYLLKCKRVSYPNVCKGLSEMLGSLKPQWAAIVAQLTGKKVLQDLLFCAGINAEKTDNELYQVMSVVRGYTS